METATITVPKRLVEEIIRRGFDPEDFILNSLVEKLGLDPRVEMEIHGELAERYLEEGRNMIEKDPVQASEKLYKAVEECVKALARYYRLEGVLESVRGRERWTVTDLERAVREISRKVGKWFMIAWGEANYLHVWGFHESKLDSEAVMERIEYVEKAVEEVKKLEAQSRS